MLYHVYYTLKIIAQARTSQAEPHPQKGAGLAEKMSLMKALVAGALKLLMISGGIIATLIGVVISIITHPLTAFKKKKRESE